MISGDLIREARRRAGLTQRQLAERAGKAPSVIGRWERGEVKPPLETVVEMIRACGLDLGLGIYESDDGHDLTLIRRELRRTPAERVETMLNFVRFIAAARTSMSSGERVSA
jgi:transcriptional regulator with XRE-family HTH domain